MIKTTAINSVTPQSMTVTWDTGRRCNFDCTYCESTRHDNISLHHTLEEYIKTFAFIKQWTSIYNQHRKDYTHTNINFTGGEPTLNKVFWDLADHIKNDPDEFRLSLTTNGAWNPKYTEKIIKRFSGVTVSYHAEGHTNLKKQVIENILALKDTEISLQVNVMMHTDYWNECVEVYQYLKDKNVSAKIRPIGDGNIERKGWFFDEDGSLRRTTHEYTKEQQDWYYRQIGIGTNQEKKKAGTDLGRGCCGGRCLIGKVEDKWQKIDVVETNFKNWNCMVDWFFLHIDQHTGLIYHHQTCQALHNQKRGAVGSIDDSEEIIQSLKVRLQNPKPITCPNSRCGCGMCVPKAKYEDDFETLWNSIIK